MICELIRAGHEALALMPFQTHRNLKPTFPFWHFGRSLYTRCFVNFELAFRVPFERTETRLRRLL